MNTTPLSFLPFPYRILRLTLVAILLTGVLFVPGSTLSAMVGTQANIPGPAGSGEFGQVTVLPNGNIIVVDAGYDAPGPIPDVGAVYLYNGATRALISTLTGSTTGDRIGSGGVKVLSNGSYVVASPNWDSDKAEDAGTATWGSGSTGASGVISAANSLVGSTAGDHVGGVMALSNGNYLVMSPDWHNGAAAGAGALTWGDGTTGVSGVVSSSNSLVGSTAGDVLGSGGITALANDGYVVRSPDWDNGPAVNAGAVTWLSGTTNVSGEVSAANSLVGSTADDAVGGSCWWCTVTLPNGNYIVQSPDWHNGAEAAAGAMTWGSGTTGVSGVVSAANSLVGSTAGDKIGSGGVTMLTNGNYVVVSPYWQNGPAEWEAGAVTWGSGTTGVSGVVSAANSLVGSIAGDRVGHAYSCAVCVVTPLSNGNYVVLSPEWSNGAAYNAGAVTWGNGATGVSGAVSAANSLVGTTAADWVGGGDCHSCLVALSNGNYVVASSWWHNGAAAGAGAVTWGNGLTGVRGEVSTANSLVGSIAGDHVGGVTGLTNGNYLVLSSGWDNGAAVDVGAATWGSGTTGVHGIISAANSLVGSSAEDFTDTYISMLSNGNFLVVSDFWDNGATSDAGAVTWGSGTTGVSGVISPANSLVGSTDHDLVGAGGVTKLSNGNYVVESFFWDNGPQADAGAVTWGSGATGVSGPVSAANSLVGSSAKDYIGFDYNSVVNSVRAFTNGNYVVRSPTWDNGSAADAGAVTWGNGTTGVHGAVSAANSLVGLTAGDQVGYAAALSSDSYLVWSPFWHNGAAAEAGAVTWGSGTTGVSGAVSAANSLVGSTAGDRIGSSGVAGLSDGSYLVRSPYWDNGAADDAGAVTWGNDATGVIGVVSAANSVVGSSAGDRVGEYQPVPLSNASYVLWSPEWDNGPAANAGAVTLGTGMISSPCFTHGAITPANSVPGTAAAGGSSLNFTYDPVNHQLVVGRPADNMVSLFVASECAYLSFVPAIKK